MRITLIRPRFAEGYQTPARMEPLALGILAALTPPHHTLRVVDERVELLDPDAPTDLAAFSVCTFSARRAYELAARYRQRGVPVVMGGYHPTLVPEEAAEQAEAVVVGDAEETWPQVLADAEAGALRRRYQAGPGPAGAVAPDRRVFRGKGYLPVRMVQYGRGCPRSCEFCSVRAFYGGCVRHRSLDAVLQELEGARRVFFVDDNLRADRGALGALLEAILPLNLRWSSQMDLGLADDPELLDLARRSGCESLTIGFESLGEENLRQMGKAWNRAASYQERLARIRGAGIMVYGTFLFGYDGDTPESFARTLAFAQRQRLFLANFNPLQPFPGTPLYDRLARAGRLVYERWWLEPGYRWHEALVKPEGMSPEALTRGCRWARERFHALPSLLRRLPDRANLRHLPVYLAANAVSWMDLRAKSRLGAP